MTRPMGPRSRRRAGRVAGRVLAGVLVAGLAAGGFAIHYLLGFSLAHYRAAATAASLHGDIGELVGINLEVAGSGSVNYSQIAVENQTRAEIVTAIATLRTSGFNRAAVGRLADQTAMAFTGLDGVQALLARGAVTGSGELSAATATNDTTLDALMKQAEDMADLLQGGANRSAGLASRGVVGVGLGMLAAVATLLTLVGRRRGRAAADQAERQGLARFEAMVEESSDLSMVTDTRGLRT